MKFFSYSLPSSCAAIHQHHILRWVGEGCGSGAQGPVPASGAWNGSQGRAEVLLLIKYSFIKTLNLILQFSVSWVWFGDWLKSGLLHLFLSYVHLMHSFIHSSLHSPNTNCASGMCLRILLFSMWGLRDGSWLQGAHFAAVEMHECIDDLGSGIEFGKGRERGAKAFQRDGEILTLNSVI